jgi:uncharacterized protein with PIN domain
MKTASIRFYAELNDFLPQRDRHKTLPHVFNGRESVKDAIESHGVPHTEIDLILVNGLSVTFSHSIEDGDRISVYPVFEAIDIQSLVLVRPRALRDVRFVLDTHLGRLASYLRMAGFDTLYRNDYRDQELADVSAGERRVLLTRDQALLKRRNVTHGYWLRETRPRRQLIEILRCFDLTRLIQPFSRCLRCNAVLHSVQALTVAERLQPRTLQAFNDFRCCPSCQRVYWKGSHYEWMTRFLEHTLAEASRALETP